MADSPLREPARVLMVDLSTRIGGASFRVLGLMERMKAHVVGLAALQGSPVALRAADREIPVFELARRKWDPRILVRLVRIIRYRKVRILDTQNIQSKLWSCLSLPFTDTSLVSTLNSWYAAEFGESPKGRIYQGLELATAGCTDRFIAVSPEIRDKLLCSGISPRRVTFIPNAVELNPLEISVDREALHRTYRLPEHTFVCCAVGRLVAAKGFDLLIKALALLKDLPIFCLVIGDGNLRPFLSRLIGSLGLTERVKLIGLLPRSKVLEIVGACDLFLMPSRTEGMPLALLEAAALGCPIVASRVGGIPEIVSHGENAILFHPEDRQALVAAIRRLAAEPETRRRLAISVQRHIMANFGTQRQVNATMKIYQGILEKTPSRKAAGGYGPISVQF